MISPETDPRAGFLASLNHEVRTPLSGILGMTDLLLETNLDAEQNEYVRATRMCAENLLEMLNAALEYSALSNDRVELEESEFALRELLESVAGEMEVKARAKGLRLIRTFDQALPLAAVGDALRLRQILSHLIANAIKFTEHGFVEITAFVDVTSGRDLTLTIRVTDTGIGIAPDHLEAVFESFRQVETGLARRYGGLGLGLSLVQRVASLMGGEVSVSSQLGQGSTFSVRIPFRIAREVKSRGEQIARGQRVLVVDDNSIAQTITRHVLRKSGYDVECAESGPDAITAAARSQFDIVLMDLQMPGMDGFETAAAIRAMEPYAMVPIIALTANSEDDYRGNCLHEGLNGFLTKPFRPNELVEIVESHIGRRRGPQLVERRSDIQRSA